MAEIRIVNLLRVFGTLRAVDNLNYTFSDGKVTCLLGPSGCGKTTLLRMIAGLETVTDGQIYFGDKEITGLSTRERNIGMVFQYPVVYKGLTVEENIALPLKKAKLDKAEIEERLDESMSLLAIQDIRKRDAWELPSVLRQKVSVAREVARRPDIILFDEPLTNVDANSKTLFKRSFKELTQKLQQTIVYVTHDQTEAMTFGDHIALMQSGKVVQFDAPRELYNHPREVFGGWFLGNPGMNFFKPAVDARDGGSVVTLPLIESAIETEKSAEELTGMSLGIRPEHIVVSKTQTAERSVKVPLKHKWIVVGGQYLLTSQIGDTTFRIKVSPELGREIDGDFYCRVPMERLMAYDRNGVHFAL